MIDLRSHLRDGDPVTREGELAPADAMRMRQNILSAVPTTRVVATWRLLPFTATLILICVAAAWIVRESAPDRAVLRAELPRQQMQFVTPNGTLVIWTFNPDLKVR